MYLNNFADILEENNYLGTKSPKDCDEPMNIYQQSGLNKYSKSNRNEDGLWLLLIQ